MLKKSFILSFLLTAKIFGMEPSLNPEEFREGKMIQNPESKNLLSRFLRNSKIIKNEKTNDIEMIDVEKFCWIMMIPKEIILEIVNFALSSADNENELIKVIGNFSSANKYFNNLLKEESGAVKLVWLNALNKLEKIKHEFYGQHNLRWGPVCFYKLNDRDLVAFSKTNLLKQVKEFAKKKEINVYEARRQNVGYMLKWALKLHDSDRIKLCLPNFSKISYEELVGVFKAAVNNGYFYITELLIKNGVNVNQKYEGGQTALMLATYYGQEDIVKLLLEKGAALDEKEERGKTSLMIAAESGNKEMVKLLLEKGSDIDEKDKNAKTALMLAAYNGHKEILEMLIYKNAKINERDNVGFTALMRARTDKEMLLLLENGAELTHGDLKKLNAGYFFKIDKVIFLEAYLKQKENAVENNSTSKKDSCIIS